MRSFETRKRSFAYDCTFKTFTSDITVTPGHRELQLLLLLALLMLSLPTTTAVITTVFFLFSLRPICMYNSQYLEGYVGIYLKFVSTVET